MNLARLKREQDKLQEKVFTVHPVVREDRDSCGQLEEFAYPLD